MNYFYALFDGAEKKGGAFVIKKSEAKEYNQKGYGIFFAVNEFNDEKRIESNLKSLRFWFIDLDTGRKESQFEKIKNFPLVPTMVVQTKKGHHVYWACKEQPSVDEYKNIIERLVNHFDSDKNAKGVTRLLRVPQFYHMKDPVKPYLIKKIFECDLSYTTQEMDQVLPQLPQKEIKTNPVTCNVLESDDFWQRASSLSCTYALQRLSGASELRGDVILIQERVGSKKHLIINGKPAPSLWIDSKDQIGSHSDGGPTIVQWVKWYGHNNAKVAEILKKYIPELREDLSSIENFSKR